ncbi:MAG TPA: hypothetical protein VLE02_06640 [Nitrosarchaeum sp.]|nr:hypothetical protein [Nitrosarchaeum sp.]
MGIGETKMNYPKEYTVKEWKKFDKEIDGSQVGNQYQFFNYFTQRMESFESITAQEILLQKYDVILTDYKTKKEKLFAVLDKFNAKNINKGIDKFNKGVDQFSKVVASNQGSSKSKKLKLGISQKDYDKLFKTPKRKGNTMNFWDEDKKTRKRRNKRKPVQKAPDYSALIGKRKVKFF